MERLKSMKECLMGVVQGQMSNLQCVDTKELGEAIDMIKDLEEAMYYCSITKAMEEKEKEYHHYYTERIKEPYYLDRDRDMDRRYGRMYYNEGNNNASNGSSNSSSNGSNGGRSYYEEREVYPSIEMRDHREGRSPISRRMYMESKEMHKDKLSNLKDLEHYMKELSEDVTEMIEGASTEEKQLLQKKLTMLAQKITND